MPKQKKKRMTLIGIGLKFTMISCIYMASVLGVHFLWLSHLTIPIPRALSLVFGILFVIIGMPVYLIAGLTVPIFMYVVFKIFIVEEDKYLEDKFGEEFLKYKKRVGEIFPKFLTAHYD